MKNGLFAVTDNGPVRLPAPENARQLGEFYAGLPLGVYTVIRTHEHRSFIGLDRHLARLGDSLGRVGDAYRPDAARLRRAIDAVCALATVDELRIRLDVLGAAIEVEGATPTRELVGFVELAPPPAEAYGAGVAARTVAAIERADPKAKTADFANRRRALEAQGRGVFESLMYDRDGNLVEGLSSSLFTVRGGRLCTAGEGVLSGVTRAIVLELAAAEGMTVDLTAAHRDSIGSLDEAFLCSSSRGIVPIVSIDGQRIGRGVPGPVTRLLGDAYRAHVRTQARPAI